MTLRVLQGRQNKSREFRHNQGYSGTHLFADVRICVRAGWVVPIATGAERGTECTSASKQPANRGCKHEHGQRQQPERGWPSVHHRRFAERDVVSCSGCPGRKPADGKYRPGADLTLERMR